MRIVCVTSVASPNWSMKPGSVYDTEAVGFPLSEVEVQRYLAKGVVIEEAETVVNVNVEAPEKPATRAKAAAK